MAKFKFRLESLWKLREAERDERRAQLGEATRARQVLAEQLDEKTAELEQLRTRYGDAAAPGRVEIDRLLHAQRFEVVVRGELDGLRQQTRMLDEEIERRRLALVEADRQLRVLEKLKEKQQERFRREQDRREMKELDEMAARRPTSELR
jgi:flagellar FliJ protein